MFETSVYIAKVVIVGKDSTDCVVISVRYRKSKTSFLTAYRRLLNVKLRRSNSQPFQTGAWCMLCRKAISAVETGDAVAPASLNIFFWQN